MSFRDLLCGNAGLSLRKNFLGVENKYFMYIDFGFIGSYESEELLGGCFYF